MLVYPNMSDETIGQDRYRTGEGDRAIPLALAIAGLVAVPAIAWASGPYLWPWGVTSMGLVALGAVAGLIRWWTAQETVGWVDGALEFHRHGRVTRVDPSLLTAVQVRPSAAQTLLVAGEERWTLSHRLVRADELIAPLRSLRPDLFPIPRDRLTLRVSGLVAGLQGALAVGTAGAGVGLWPWQPWLGGLFVLIGVYVLVREFWTLPVAYEVSPGAVTVRFLLGHRRWESPWSIHEESYAAGGALFFQLVLRFGNRTLVIDEGRLLDPLRPHSAWVQAQFLPPSP